MLLQNLFASLRIWSATEFTSSTQSIPNIKNQTISLFIIIIFNHLINYCLW